MSKGKMKLKESYLKRKEQQKGITLIALVITIVILIILATITINFVFGENGLINKANQAKDMYIKGDERETITLAIATIEAELKPVERDNLQTKIEDLRGAESVEVTPFAGALQVKFKKTGNIYLVGTNGEIIDNNEEINLSLNAIYDMSTGEGKVLYFMPIFQYEGQDIMNPQSISEEEMRNISLELMKSISKMSQAEKETWLLWFCTAMVYMSDNPTVGV